MPARSFVAWSEPSYHIAPGRGWYRRTPGCDPTTVRVDRRASRWWWPPGPVPNGLRWLVRHQDGEGGWDPASFPDRCAARACDGRGDRGSYLVETALSVLALLGAGVTPLTVATEADPVTGRCPHPGTALSKGVLCLVRHQDAAGGFGAAGPASDARTQAVCALALSEAWGLTDAAIIKEPAQRALDRLIEGERQAGRPPRPPTVSRLQAEVRAWSLLALRSARVSGLQVPFHALADLAKNPPPPVGLDLIPPPMPAAPDRDDALAGAAQDRDRQAVQLLARALTVVEYSRPRIGRGRRELSQEQLGFGPPVGDDDPFAQLLNSLTFDSRCVTFDLERRERQTGQNDGCRYGSWDVPKGSEGRGSRVYATAMSLLTLEVTAHSEAGLGYLLLAW